MAKTNGHRNPPWTREETILALNLLIDADMSASSVPHQEVIALSAFIRSLPVNRIHSENLSFRNPAGIAFKLLNLQAIATGKGFANGSYTDKLVWAQFENRRLRLKETVQLIQAYAPTEDALNEVDAGDEEDEFLEGSIVTRVHKRIERNAGLRHAVLKQRINAGRLRCDICEATNPTKQGELECAIFEVHHLKPLSTTGKTRTFVRDAALLCANCHRLTHKLIKTFGRWIAIDDLRDLIAPARGIPLNNR